MDYEKKVVKNEAETWAINAACKRVFFTSPFYSFISVMQPVVQSADYLFTFFYRSWQILIRSAKFGSLGCRCSCIWNIWITATDN